MHLHPVISDVNIDHVRKFNRFDKSNPHRDNNRKMNPDYISKCRFCSYGHKRGACPAYSKNCNNCNRKGHFSKSVRENRRSPYTEISVYLTNTEISVFLVIQRSPDFRKRFFLILLFFIILLFYYFIIYY